MTVFNKADILIPKKDIDPSKWSVIACDQYTSQPDYWDRVKAFAGGSPSAYNIIFPEAYLGDNDAARIAGINASMEKYLSEGVFDTVADSMIYVRRTQRDGRVREGIIGAADLEEYDFAEGSSSLIRATEGTILERIPPRVKIRENAPLELPHIIMLIDDDGKTVIEPLGAETDKMEKLYDFELMEASGRLEGYRISGERAERLSARLGAMADREYFDKKYGHPGKPVLLMAVGDGNHSLATAKTCWEKIKPSLTPDERKTHPARFALAELENIHSPALDFKPIHRVVFGVQPKEMLAELERFYDISRVKVCGAQKIEYVCAAGDGALWIKNPKSSLPAGSLQIFIDKYIAARGGRVDYIHGADVVRELAKEKDAVGFLAPEISKSDLFRTVIADGAMPRKTFSMGEAHDKRFYYEAKKIVR